MPASHSANAPAPLQMEPASPPLLPVKSPAAASIPNLTEPSDAPRSSATVASAAATDTLRHTCRIPTNDFAARAAPCPSPLHPNMARTAASPGGTAVFLCPYSPCESWHHLNPSTPSSYLRPQIPVFRSGQSQFIPHFAHIRR